MNKNEFNIAGKIAINARSSRSVKIAIVPYNAPIVNVPVSPGNIFDV